MHEYEVKWANESLYSVHEDSCSDWQPFDNESPSTPLFAVKPKYAHNEHNICDVDSNSNVQDIQKAYSEDRKSVHTHSEQSMNGDSDAEIPSLQQSYIHCGISSNSHSGQVYSGSEMYIPFHKKKKGGHTDYSKQNYCLLCGKLLTVLIARHYISAHADDPSYQHSSVQFSLFGN